MDIFEVKMTLTDKRFELTSLADRLSHLETMSKASELYKASVISIVKDAIHKLDSALEELKFYKHAIERDKVRETLAPSENKE